jgi:hypothetical protein
MLENSEAVDSVSLLGAEKHSSGSDLVTYRIACSLGSVKGKSQNAG